MKGRCGGEWCMQTVNDECLESLWRGRRRWNVMVRECVWKMKHTADGGGGMGEETDHKGEGRFKVLCIRY